MTFAKLPFICYVSLLLSVSTSFLLESCIGCRLPFDPDRHDLEVTYKGWQESIHISNRQISHSKTEFFFSQPQHSTPDSSVRHQLLDAQAISTSQWRKLTAQLVDSGFFELDSQYGAPPSSRHYLYSIEIKFPAPYHSHTVVYRSNPAYGSAPEAFEKTKRILQEFADSLTH